MELNIKEPFAEQYVMIVESNMKAINMHLISRTLMRWDFNVLKVNELKILRNFCMIYELASSITISGYRKLL